MAPPTIRDKSRTAEIPTVNSEPTHGKNQHDVRYSSLLETDNVGLAWEWLRRDPAYSDFYIGCERPEITHDGSIRIIRLTGDNDAKPWGLVFR